jgi:hypothetical protein
MKYNFLFLISILSLSLILGCSKSNTIEPSTTGTLELRMIDSPAGYDEVNIVVDSIRVHVDNGDTTSGWVTLNHMTATYNLLKLTNGLDTLIARADVPTGLYSQIRLFIGSGSNVVVDGITHPLTTPSGSQSGVKLNVHSLIQPDVKYILTIDFDANRSIVKTGNPHNPDYILKPVIRTVATGVTGIISGIVLPESTKSAIWGYTSTDTVSTFADTTGHFKLVYLSPAIYSVHIVPSDTMYRDTTLSNVVVNAAQTTSLGTINLAHK